MRAATGVTTSYCAMRRARTPARCGCPARSRIASASSRPAASRTASASRAALRIARARSKQEQQAAERRELDAAAAARGSAPRPSRRARSAAPSRSPRSARAPTRGSSALRLLGGVRPSAPSEPPAARDLGEPLEHLGGRQLAVAARAEHGAGDAASAERGAAASRTASASGLAEPGLVAVGQDVAADVEQDDVVAAQPLGRVAQRRRRPRAGPGWGSTSTTSARRSARPRRASAKRKPPGPVVSGPASADGLVERARRAVDLVQRRGPGQRVDRRGAPSVRPPTTASRPRPRGISAQASAPTTSPPPPMPTTSRRARR